MTDSTDLDAPYWEPHIRVTLLWLTRDTDIKHVVRSALESVSYQIKDLMGTIVYGGTSQPTKLRVDGGMTTNNWVRTFLAYLLQFSVEHSVRWSETF